MKFPTRTLSGLLIAAAAPLSVLSAQEVEESQVIEVEHAIIQEAVPAQKIHLVQEQEIEAKVAEALAKANKVIAAQGIPAQQIRLVQEIAGQQGVIDEIVEVVPGKNSKVIRLEQLHELLADSNRSMAMQREMEHLAATLQSVHKQLEHLSELETHLTGETSASRDRLVELSHELAGAAKAYMGEVTGKLKQHKAAIAEGKAVIEVQEIEKLRELAKREQLHQHQILVEREKEAAELHKRHQADQKKHQIVLEQARAKAMEAQARVAAAKETHAKAMEMTQRTVEGYLKKMAREKEVAVADAASESRLSELESRLDRIESLLEKLIEK